MGSWQSEADGTVEVFARDETRRGLRLQIRSVRTGEADGAGVYRLCII